MSFIHIFHLLSTYPFGGIFFFLTRSQYIFELQEHGTARSIRGGTKQREVFSSYVHSTRVCAWKTRTAVPRERRTRENERGQGGDSAKSHRLPASSAEEKCQVSGIAPTEWHCRTIPYDGTIIRPTSNNRSRRYCKRRC